VKKALILQALLWATLLGSGSPAARADVLPSDFLVYGTPYFENTARVIVPSKANPLGQIVVVTGQPRSTATPLYRPLLSLTGIFDTTSVASASAFPYGPTRASGTDTSWSCSKTAACWRRRTAISGTPWGRTRSRGSMSASRAATPTRASVRARFSSAPPMPARPGRWLHAQITYDASVSYPPSGVASTLKYRRGHCGHKFMLLEQFCTRCGIPIRGVWGLNLYAPDGKGELGAIRLDYVNIHTWAEVYFPSGGWIEVEPDGGDRAFVIGAQYIQNNRWFQNYSVWVRENGQKKQPSWTYQNGRYISDYGLENLITYTMEKK
jgi:hypothetical protein